MPSKKKKAKGKARGAAKSRKELSNDSAANEVKQDEDALLEEAINLAAAEREQLEAAAKNDEENNVERCNHGFSPLPRGHVCARFIPSFLREFVHQNGCLRSAIEALTTKYDGILHDPDNLDLVVSSFLEQGTDMLLRGNDDNARRSAVFAAIFEQFRVCRAMTFNNATEDLKKCTLKIKELANDTCDVHTLVSFFRKRIPCKCLDERYKEVKSIVKMGHCMNPDCPLPNMKAECSKLMKCEQCRLMQYCSIACQRAHWPTHKEDCVKISRKTG